MKTIRDKKLYSLLSQYLDNNLREKERRTLELYLEENEEARKKLEELRRARSILRNKPPAPENETFYSQLQRRIEEDRATNIETFSFKQRFMPIGIAVAACTVVFFVFLGIVQQGNPPGGPDPGPGIVEAGAGAVIDGWIMPLFKRADKNLALHYALFGTLPFGEDDDAVLQVDHSEENGYGFELGQGNAPYYADVTVDRLYNEISPSFRQRLTLDSILEAASSFIEEGVLLDEKNHVAISPAVAELQQVVLGHFAATLRPSQRRQMERFMRERNSPYALVVDAHSDFTHSAPPSSIVCDKNTYVVLSPDTVLLTELVVNRNSMREHMERITELEATTEQRLHELTVRLARTRERRSQTTRNIVVESRTDNTIRECNVTIDPGVVRVQIVSNAPRAKRFVYERFIAQRTQLAHIVSAAQQVNVAANSFAPHSRVHEREEIIDERQMHFVINRDANGRMYIDVDLDSILSSTKETIEFLQTELQRLEAQEREFRARWITIESTFDSLEKNLDYQIEDTLFNNSQTIEITPDITSPGVERILREEDRDRLQQFELYRQKLKNIIQEVKQGQR